MIMGAKKKQLKKDTIPLFICDFDLGLFVFKWRRPNRAKIIIFLTSFKNRTFHFPHPFCDCYFVCSKQNEPYKMGLDFFLASYLIISFEGARQ